MVMIMQRTLPDLDLRGRRSIPASVWDRDDLLRLVVADMELTELPPDVGRLTGLTTLDAAHNRLRAVPEELARLGALEILYLGENELSERARRRPGAAARCGTSASMPTASPRFRTGSADLASLVELRVQGNAIAQLPETIGGLGALRELHTRGNRLTALPASIRGLRELRVLDLRDNALTELPRSSAGCDACARSTCARTRCDRCPTSSPAWRAGEARPALDAVLPRPPGTGPRARGARVRGAALTPTRGTATGSVAPVSRSVLRSRARAASRR